MSDDLAAFILARIAEHEEEINAHEWVLGEDGRGDPYWSCIGEHGCHVVVDVAGRHECEPPRALVLESSRELRRGLAECEAKRRIIEELEFQKAELRRLTETGRGSAPRAHTEARIVGLTFAVAALALPYADHPDFRPEWRP